MSMIARFSPPPVTGQPCAVNGPRAPRNIQERAEVIRSRSFSYVLTLLSFREHCYSRKLRELEDKKKVGTVPALAFFWSMTLFIYFIAITAEEYPYLP